MTTDLHPAPVVGSSVLVERLTANLVQNAICHSPPGVEAIVRTGRWDDHAILEVENPGGVLRQYEVDRMFEPFRRGEAASFDPLVEPLDGPHASALSCGCQGS